MSQNIEEITISSFPDFSSKIMGIRGRITNTGEGKLVHKKFYVKQQLSLKWTLNSDIPRSRIK